MTHSSLAVGLFGLVEFFPLLPLAFVGGALADAFDRQRARSIDGRGVRRLLASGWP